MLRVFRVRQCLREIGVAWSATDIFGRTAFCPSRQIAEDIGASRLIIVLDLDLVTPVITVVVDVDKRLA